MMKILLLCNKSPWPLHEGGPMAMHAIINGLLKAGHTIKVLAVNTNKYSVDPLSIPPAFADATKIEFAYIDLAVKPLPALYNYLTGQSYHVTRFMNQDFKGKLERILSEESFDIIQVEMLYTSIYLETIRKYSKAPVVLRAHNIEHLIWQRIADNCRNPLKRHYLKHLYHTLREYELNIINKVDGIVAITGIDALFFGRNAKNVPVLSIPFGIDPDSYPINEDLTTEPDLFHIGSMNWFPNDEGIRWFLDQVWPEVIKKENPPRLCLAGRMMPAWLRGLKMRNVEVVGEVPNAWEFIQQHAVMIVPLLSGSGIRVKIVEAMMAGKAVISTRIGAEGIEYVDGTHLIIADTRDQFVTAIERVMNDAGLRKSLGENARSLMLSKHDNNKLIDNLSGFYQRLIQRH